MLSSRKSMRLLEKLEENLNVDPKSIDLKKGLLLGRGLSP